VEPDRKEFSYQEYCHLLDQMAEAGCLWLIITGGEPMVRRDFLDIYEYAKGKGFIIILYTNGTLITPEIADRLRCWRPKTVEITMYGATRETYERVSGVPGSFDRAIRGLELLAERGISLVIKAMALTLNRHEIGDIKKYARKLGAEFRYDPVVWPRLDGMKDPYRVRLEPEEVIQLELEDEDRPRAWREFAQKFLHPVKSEFLYWCGSGVHSFFIDAFGRLSLCIEARHPYYDLRKGTFAEAWEQFLPAVKNTRCTKDFACLHCDLVNLCGRCPPFSQQENRDPESVVPFLCRLAHLRVEAYGLRKLQEHGAPQTSLSASNIVGERG
jgi:radical SAM protein with 4Fe4S-binding SPASM domain